MIMKSLLILLTLSAFFIRSFLKNPIGVSRRLCLYFYYLITGKKILVIEVPQIKNYKMVLDLNSHLDRSIFLSGLFGDHIEENSFNFLSKNLKKDSVFFDIGANSGFFTLFASLIIKTGFIHSFEPVPRAYNNFKKSVQLNKIKNINVNNLCIGNMNKKVRFNVSFHSDVSSIKVTPYQSGNKLIESEMMTLDKYCQKNNLKKMDMIKIDVEGSEKDILFNSKNILKKFKPILIIEFSNYTARAFGYHPNEIYDFLVDLGYGIYNYKRGKLEKQKKKEFYEEDLYCIYKR